MSKPTIIFTRQDLQKVRRSLIAAVKTKIRPFLHESGYRQSVVRKGCYRTGWITSPSPFYEDSKAVYLCTLKKAIHLKFCDEVMEGFTETGIITEAGVGLVTIDFSKLPVEDLLTLSQLPNDKFDLTRDKEKRQENGI